MCRNCTSLFISPSNKHNCPENLYMLTTHLKVFNTSNIKYYSKDHKVNLLLKSVVVFLYECCGICYDYLFVRISIIPSSKVGSLAINYAKSPLFPSTAKKSCCEERIESVCGYKDTNLGQFNNMSI